jgi:hypothetical protein
LRSSSFFRRSGTHPLPEKPTKYPPFRVTQ